MKKIIKLVIKHPEVLEGMTRQEIFSLLGNDYYSEYAGDLLLYIISIGFGRRRPILIYFDFEGIVQQADVIQTGREV